MFSLRRLLVALLVATSFVAVVSRTSRAQIQDRSDLVPALDSTAAAYAADSMVAGISVAVVRGADTLLLEGYGQADLAFDVPTPASAIYPVGSITKQFTTAAVLQLAAQGSLDLDAEITEYLPDYNTRGHPITVRQLLYHTSGIPNYVLMADHVERIRTDLPRDTALSLIENRPLHFVPGTAASYSTTGYFLLGFIIEETSGQSFAEYVDEHLFKPAEMDDSHYCDEGAVTERGTRGYSWTSEGGLVPKRYVNYKWPYASGALCSTAGDLVAWNRALHGGQILSDASYRQMISPGTLADGTKIRYGMGLRLYEVGGHAAIHHSGRVFGYDSHLRYYPEADLTIAVLQNTDNSRQTSSLTDSLSRLIVGQKDVVETDDFSGDHSEFEGRYVGPGLGALEVRIEQEGDHLVARGIGVLTPLVTGPLQYRSGLTWQQETSDIQSVEGTSTFRFVRAGERVVRLRIDLEGNHWVLRRVE